MPYQHIENAMSRRREKIAPFLTAENACGILLCAGPVYLLTAQMDGLLLRIGLLGLAALLGYQLTREVDGLPLYERILCRVRGHLRGLLRGRTLQTDEFTAVVVRTDALLLPADGPVRLLPRAPHQPIPAATALRASAERRRFQAISLPIAHPGVAEEARTTHAHDL